MKNNPLAGMLILSMNGSYEVKNRWADKIAFFGFFIVVLLIASFIVKCKSAVVLSEPIELVWAGLSVRNPTGSGWISARKWKYQQNTFILESFFAPGPGRVTTLVSCRYFLAAAKTAPEVLFKEKTLAVDGLEIVRTGKIEVEIPGSSFAEGPQSKSITFINWAYFKGSEALFDTFFGVVQLPGNRRLDIEVHHDTSDTEMAQEIFSSVVNSLKFTDNELLGAGSKIIAEIKGKGLDNFLTSISNKEKFDQESFFIIKDRDARGRKIGFIMETMGTYETQRFRAWSYYYIRGRYEQEEISFFQSGNNFNEFVWKSEASGLGGRSGIEIVLYENGIMTVKEFDLQASEKDYQISPAAIPGVLVKFLFRQMLDSSQKEIFVDIIGTDGRITPTLISRIEVSPSVALRNRNSGADVAEEETAYVFRVEFFKGQGFSQQVYLDGQKQITKMLLRQESTLIVERTDAENILREFPEQGSYILKRKDKILEHSQLQRSGEQQLPVANY